MKNYLKKNENSETEERNEIKERREQLRKDREHLHNLFDVFYRENDDERLHDIIVKITQNHREEYDCIRYEKLA